MEKEKEVAILKQEQVVEDKKDQESYLIARLEDIKLNLEVKERESEDAKIGITEIANNLEEAYRALEMVTGEYKELFEDQGLEATKMQEVYDTAQEIQGKLLAERIFIESHLGIIVIKEKNEEETKLKQMQQPEEEDIPADTGDSDKENAVHHKIRKMPKPIVLYQLQ